MGPEGRLASTPLAHLYTTNGRRLCWGSGLDSRLVGGAAAAAAGAASPGACRACRTSHSTQSRSGGSLVMYRLHGAHGIA